MNEHDLLARAFHDDPFLRWAEPDAARRPRALARMFAGLLRYVHGRGGRLYEPGVGSVHWRDGASAEMGTWAIFTSGTWRLALTAPPSVCARLARHEDEAMGRVVRHLRADSTYLCTLGIEPSVAGQGHGSRLLQRALEAMRGTWRHCVLRTEQPKNLPFYRRNGFVEVEAFTAAASGLRSWVFARAL